MSTNFMLFIVLMIFVSLFAEITDEDKIGARKARLAAFLHRDRVRATQK